MNAWIRPVFLFMIALLSRQLLAAYQEPHLVTAYYEELVAEIRSLPEEERYHFLSYTNVVNSDYWRVVHKVIVAETVLQQYKKDGTSESSPAYVSKVNELKRFREYLEKETERFLGYLDMRIRIGQLALGELLDSKYEDELRRDYYSVVYNRLLVEELLKMKDEDLYLYLRDSNYVNLGYVELVDEMVLKQSILSRLKSDVTTSEKQHYLQTEKELEKIMAGLHKESERVLKFLAIQATNSEHAIKKARERLKKEKEFRVRNAFFVP